jgi:hypothetical protein
MRPGPLQNDGGDAFWARAERSGYRSGHVVCRCPACGMRQLVSYRGGKSFKPRCRVCTPYVPVSEKPLLEVVSDLSRIAHKRPGWPRSKRQLLEDGCVVVAPSLPSSDATGS